MSTLAKLLAQCQNAAEPIDPGQVIAQVHALSNNDVSATDPDPQTPTRAPYTRPVAPKPTNSILAPAQKRAVLSALSEESGTGLRSSSKKKRKLAWETWGDTAAVTGFGVFSRKDETVFRDPALSLAEKQQWEDAVARQVQQQDLLPRHTTQQSKMPCEEIAVANDLALRSGQHEDLQRDVDVSYIRADTARQKMVRHMIDLELGSPTGPAAFVKDPAKHLNSEECRALHQTLAYMHLKTRVFAPMLQTRSTPVSVCKYTVRLGDLLKTCNRYGILLQTAPMRNGPAGVLFHIQGVFALQFCGIARDVEQKQYEDSSFTVQYAYFSLC